MWVVGFCVSGTVLTAGASLSRARLVDVALTILASAGFSVPPEMQGKPRMREAKPGRASAKNRSGSEDRPAYAETDYPHRAFGWSALRALRSGKYLYIQAPERELYNQSADPAAARNLARDTKAVADTMAAQLDDFHQKTSQTLIDLAKPDPDQMKKLQALGYVGSAAGKKKE